MSVLEIFKAGNGKMMYVEIRENCYCSGSLALANFAIRVTDLADFLAMADDELVLLSDCPERDERFKPLKPFYKVSEVDSLVVVDAWLEGKTPAVALYGRDSDNGLILKRVCLAVEDIPQCFWEIWYPSVCARVAAKIQGYFDVRVDSGRFWYFVGKNTKTLYIVDETESTVDTYNSYCGIETGKDVRELGASDGLDLNELRQPAESIRYYRFKLDALDKTDYYSRALNMPEDIMALASSNPDVERILKQFLTEDEFALL